MKTKEEIIIEKMKKYCPELYVEGKVYDKVTDGGLTINGWQAIEDAMDEWHRQELPTEEEINDQFGKTDGNVRTDMDNRMLIHGAKWCRDFVRKEKEEPRHREPLTTDEPKPARCIEQYHINSKVNLLTFNIPVGFTMKQIPEYTPNNYNYELCVFEKEPETIQGDFIWNVNKTISFHPNPNGKFTINKQ
jgi:hypothetical protein